MYDDGVPSDDADETNTNIIIINVIIINIIITVCIFISIIDRFFIDVNFCGRLGAVLRIL